MRRFFLTVGAVVSCLLARPALAPVHGAADSRVFSILQNELQRNFQVLSKQTARAYFMSYTLHD